MHPEIYYNNNFYGFDKHNRGQYSLLKLDRHQKEMLKLFHKSNNVSVIKSRQIGMTSILALYVSYMMLYSNKKSIFICTHEKQMGHYFLNRLKEILFKEPQHINRNESYKLYKDRLYYGDCLIRAIRSPKELRAYSVDLLIVDEACFVKELEGVFNLGAFIALSRGGQVIVASSQGGISDRTFKMWHDSVKKEFYTYKRQLILEKSKNIILNNDSMFYRAKFDQKSFSEL